MILVNGCAKDLKTFGCSDAILYLSICFSIVVIFDSCLVVSYFKAGFLELDSVRFDPVGLADED